MNLIELERVTKSYNNQTVAVSNVDLTVHEGEVFGLLGPNGAGKTTLTKIIATILRPDSGSVRVSGYDALNNPRSVKSKVGYAGQDSENSGYSRLTTRENLLYFAYTLRGIPQNEATRRIERIANELGLDKILDKRFEELSGGQKQATIVARALLQEPTICLLDEPSKSLDPVTSRKVRAFLRNYISERNATVILSSHNMHEVEKLCDRVGFLLQGEFKFVGTISEFRKIAHQHEVITIHDKLTKKEEADLSALPRVAHIDHKEGTTDIFVDNASRSISSIIDTLHWSADQIPEINIRKPTVEDAFVQLSLTT